MNQQTIDILSKLNKQFYDETGSALWNQKPDYYWEGSYQLTKFIVAKLKELAKDLSLIDDISAKNCHLERSERSCGVQRKGDLEIKKILRRSLPAQLKTLV